MFVIDPLNYSINRIQCITLVILGTAERPTFQTTTLRKILLPNQPVRTVSSIGTLHFYTIHLLTNDLNILLI